MAQTILFVTGNKGKAATMQRHLDRLSVNAKVVQKSLDIDEIQAETATDVAIAKAKQAYSELKVPLLVDDSSFHISALGGFPGPYIKFMLSTVGIEGIIEFMQGKADRTAYFLSSLVYIDEHGQQHVFNDQPYSGAIVSEIDRSPPVTTIWSDLYYIFIPTGGEKVLAQMNQADHAAIAKNQTDSYEDFCLWFQSTYQ